MNGSIDTYPLNVRFVKLYFTLALEADCQLPMHKASAIRGGIGEMLLRANCIRNRDCENCDFYDECIVQRTMYSKFEKKPEFVTNGESVGYVINCRNSETEFKEGDEISFTLTLFGRTIVYFNQYIQALYALGRSGLGGSRARFTIKSVRNSFRKDIIDGANIYMGEYRISTIGDYVKSRMRDFEDGLPREIVFSTPLSVKHRGEVITTFDPEAVIKATQRRLYILNCFENNDVEDFYRSEPGSMELRTGRIATASIPRFSFRKQSKMVFKGIYGSAEIENFDEELLPLLLAGELMHIGKNTSFGFGEIRLKK
ncbi:MAG: CRISPR system precrRNA processing endoribonuclease RAMP protein Cas6 [Lachnospiraceae bacterium]|nr:CRISPR system precrRNA processing endoribonuclease RAMP protein Cas6 [Lachnospiraceae bacterium]